MSRVNWIQRFALYGILSALVLIAVHRAAAESGDFMSGGTSSYYSPMGSYSSTYGFSSTALEGALRGNAELVEALGNFDVSEGKAAILQQQARALDRDNDVQQTVALYAQKELWRQARESARQVRAARDAEGKVKFAELRATVYKRAYALSADELNLRTGEIHWPAALQAEKYECERRRVEKLFQAFASYPDPQPQLANEIGRRVDTLVRALRTDMGSLPRDEYLAAHKFLRGLKYAAG